MLLIHLEERGLPREQRRYYRIPDPAFHYPDYRGVCLLQTCLISNRKADRNPTPALQSFPEPFPWEKDK